MILRFPPFIKDIQEIAREYLPALKKVKIYQLQKQLEFLT
jgi:hypothetical protein